MTHEEKFAKMTQTDVRVLVSKLAIPTIISMLITTIYNMADTYFVGQLNTNATAAVGIVFPFMTIIQACGFFFGHGSGNYISKELGRQRTENAVKMAATGFFTAFAFGCMILLFGTIFRTEIIYFLGATEKIAPYAEEYLQFILIGAPFYASSLVLNNQFRFQGNAVFAMFGIAIGGVLNVILDPIFIFTFNLGIKGAAIATALSQIISFVILLIGTRNAANISIHIKNFTPSKTFYGEIFKGGAPSLFRQGLGSVTNFSMNFSAKMFSAAAGFDKEAAIAAMSIVGKVTMFAYSTVIGFGQGFQPVCGFNYGAKKYRRVREAFRFSVIVTTCFMIVAGVLLFIYAPQVIGSFNDDVVQIRMQVIDIGAKTLRITCLAFPLVGFLVLSNMMAQNLGLVFRASFLAMARQGIFYIPLVLILPRFVGFVGIQMSQAISDVLSMFVSIVLTYGVLKELKDKELEPKQE